MKQRWEAGGKAKEEKRDKRRRGDWRQKGEKKDGVLQAQRVAADEKCTIISFLLAAPPPGPPPHLAPPLSRKWIIGALLQGPFPSSRTATSTAVVLVLVVVIVVVVVPSERRTFDDRGRGAWHGAANSGQFNPDSRSAVPGTENETPRPRKTRFDSRRGKGFETLLPRYCASMNRDPWATKVSTRFFIREITIPKKNWNIFS